MISIYVYEIESYSITCREGFYDKNLEKMEERRATTRKTWILLFQLEHS